MIHLIFALSEMLGPQRISFARFTPRMARKTILAQEARLLTHAAAISQLLCSCSPIE